jgi:mannan endo-1,4-beta-mannosidase
MLPWFWIWLSLLVGLTCASQLATPATPTVPQKRAIPSNFITTENGQFRVNNSDFKFFGANAYWLPTLNTEQDIRDTLSSMSASGINVVRIWAFNDVHEVPENGTWFQLIANGTSTINTGPNGLQKLDLVVSIAESLGMYILFSLTNNWNPMPLFDNLDIPLPLNPFDTRDIPSGTNNGLPRNYLCNDYGGMDAYVREFGSVHDDFYTNDTIINHFTNYTSQIVSRFSNSATIFAWEVANDPRCASSVASGPDCRPTTVTKWHETAAKSILAADPNHLVSSGAHGFLCADCPKLFPFQPPAPPQPSPPPGEMRARRDLGPITRKRLLKQQAEARKTKYLNTRSSRPGEGSVKIRGRWVAAPAKRQDTTGIASAFDGSHGVDCEDILNIPAISFASFQLFPDQFEYGGDRAEALNPGLFFNETVENGIQWIKTQIALAQRFNKPIAMTAFGLVTQGNAPSFVPFNQSIAPFGDAEVTGYGNTSTANYGVTEQQRNDAYSQWLNTSISAGVQGILVWQWGQMNLTVVPGTPISVVDNSTSTSPVMNMTGQSPNDGYDISGISGPDLQNIFRAASQEISPST